MDIKQKKKIKNDPETFLKYVWKFIIKNPKIRKNFPEGPPVLLVRQITEGITGMTYPGIFHVIKEPSISNKRTEIDKEDSNRLIISINVEAPIDLIENLLRSHLLKIRKEANIIPKRIPWDSFETYLKIYTLWEKGMKYKDIAKAVFPFEYRTKDQDSLIKKVRRNLQKVRKIVETGQII